MSNSATSNSKRCDNTGCIGGRTFGLHDKVFCGPECLNEFFKLSPGDEDYWPHDDYSDSDSESDGEPSCPMCHLERNMLPETE